MNIPVQPGTGAACLVIVDPAAELKKATLIMAPRLGTLQGKHLAMIDNSKHNASTLLKLLEGVLVEDYGVASVEFYRKDNPSIAMPVHAMDLVASRCSAVIHGVAD